MGRNGVRMNPGRRLGGGQAGVGVEQAWEGAGRGRQDPTSLEGGTPSSWYVVLCPVV